jgi:hypothetical protein
LFWFFCGFAAKKPKHKHFSGVCNPQSPALQSGKPLSLMRMGNPAEGGHPSMGVTSGCVREPGSRTRPILVRSGVFSTKSKKHQTPRQSCGTRLRAFLAVRKQHTKQETPVEGGHPSMGVTHREREETGVPRNPIGVGDKKCLA